MDRNERRLPVAAADMYSSKALVRSAFFGSNWFGSMRLRYIRRAARGSRVHLGLGKAIVWAGGQGSPSWQGRAAGEPGLGLRSMCLRHN